MAAVDASRICLDTGPLIHYLRGREPGASAVEKVIRTSACYVTSITAYELLFLTTNIRHFERVPLLQTIAAEELVG